MISKNKFYFLMDTSDNLFMYKRFRINLFFLMLFTLYLNACKAEEISGKVSPTLISSTPGEGSDQVDVNTPVTFLFSEKIILVSTANIRLNGELVTVYVNSKTLTILETLKPNTNYTLNIPPTAIKNLEGNFAKELTLKFKTNQSALNNIIVYEAEQAELTSDASQSTSLAGFTGTGYVNTNSGNVTFNIQAPVTGYYDVSIRYSISDSKKSNDLYVDGVKVTTLDFSTVNVWTILAAGRLKLSAGAHTHWQL